MAGQETEGADERTWQTAALPNPFIFVERSNVTEPDKDLLLALEINRAFLSSQSSPLAEAAGEDVGSDSDELGNANSKSKPVRLRGVGLLGVIFDELSSQLGGEFSSAELMNAAQLLIDVTKSEYVANPYREPVERAGYYSWDLVRAFNLHAWQVAEVETQRMDHCDTEEFSLETMEGARLIREGWHERLWEF